MDRERQLQKRYGELQEEILQKQEMLAANQHAAAQQAAAAAAQASVENQYEATVVQPAVVAPVNEEV